MKRVTPLIPACLIAFSLAACQQQSDDNIAIDDTTNVADATVETLPPDEADLSNGSGNLAINEADDAGSEQPSPPGTPESTMIPAQYRGRWGMNAADCEPGRSDAKGLITIGEKTMRFYESTATLKEQRPAAAISFAGLYAFTGEGQSWQKVMTLTRTGDSLKRAEEEGNFTYRRCG